MKKKRILIILAVIIILIAIIFIVRSIINANKPKETIDDFSSVKELIEYDGHEYLGMKNSEEEGFEKDIYIKFSKPPINDDGTTNEGLYEVVISHLAGKLAGHNFRMIDQENNILVSIKFNENKEVSVYTINNDSNYWEHIKTDYQIDNYKDDTITKVTVVSPVLQNIINANWIYNNINLGTKESTVNDYEIYFDEGYKIKKIGTEIYNIVYTSNYTNEILQGITTSTGLENIKNILGEPTYYDSEANEEVIGYKCEYFYIFFSDYGISVYHLDEYNEEDSKEFGTLVTELNKTGDMNTFLNKLTDLYPYYASNLSDGNYINIKYPLQGFEVTFGTTNNNGITLYSNFKGYITEDLTIDDVKTKKIIPANVYTNLETNLVYNVECNRIDEDLYNRNPYSQAYFIQTEEYTVSRNGENYNFYSRDGGKIDSSLIIKNLTSMINYGENEFVYGVSNDGIYIYNAETLELIKIVEGNGDFNIQSINNRTIYYDNTSVNF